MAYVLPREKQIAAMHALCEGTSIRAIERMTGENLTMRMHMRRLTRLTNAFSKKIENFKAAVAPHFAYYNFVRMHGTIRATPAMEAGLLGAALTIGDLIDLAWVRAAIMHLLPAQWPGDCPGAVRLP